MNELLNFLRSDGSIIINKNLAHNIGLNETVLYSELISKYYYFHDRKMLIDQEWFFCTIQDMQNSTTIGKDKQNRLLKKLQQLGLIELKIKGVPPKRYFKVVMDENILKKYLKYNASIFAKCENQYSQNAKNINNTNINNILSKDKIGVFDKTQNIIFDKSLNGENNNQSHKKINNKKLSNIFLKTLFTWNQAPPPAQTHRYNPIRKLSNVLSHAERQYKLLKSGKFCDANGITVNDLKKLKLDIDIKSKKWTDQEIRMTIKHCTDQFRSDFAPKNKKLLPVTLDLTFFNPFSQKCKSTFLKVFAEKPKKLTTAIKTIQHIDDTILNQYIVEFFPNTIITVNEKNNIIRSVNNVITKHDEICHQSAKCDNQIYIRKTFEIESPAIVYLLDLTQFIEEHIRFIKTIIEKSDIDVITIMRTDNGFWNNFITYFETKHNVEFYPSDDDLQEKCERYLQEREEFLDII